ncbi:chemotaxis protein CheB [Spirochaeta isovalerica]|uniref:protein-glutamate O-methyltransferase n=1 Tax=Spirochaeta isovalerica TaxID=150 RepID=A0A841RAA4_9SPIO|nr:chemotaxis protein CheB [Spirochaeta isovalerica]MBB6480177.1 two-component system CheB/CheR fusion protein [Spirochaeta isovalerica]
MSTNKNTANKESPVSSFPVVGIGASAGGLEALEDFFRNMPSRPGAAFVVIQHLSPDYKSMMNELLARFTSMPIHLVEDGMAVEVNNVYLIPPRKNMTIYQGTLLLNDPLPGKVLNLPIDIFLRSLAKDQEKNAIAVILSGTGSDGTLGIRAIKEAGGISMAQDTRTAKFDGMPRSSISSGMVDFVLSPPRLADELVNYCRHPLTINSRKMEQISNENETELSKIISIIRETTGVDFGHYKPNTVLRRLEKRISLNRFNSISEYLNFLMYNEREIKTLFNELLIGVTRFFRDESYFETLSRTVIPRLFESIPIEKDLRVWVAGCSTGEEVYSLAILLFDHMEKSRTFRNIKIFATDIDTEALSFAGAGFYPENIVSDVPLPFLEKYFTRQNGGYLISDSIRSVIVFARQDLINDPPFTKIDFITCRNLLIYLETPAQQRVLSYFYMSLNDPGFLFLGNSESIGNLSEGFDCLDSKAKIYQYKKGFRLSSVNELLKREPIITNRGMGSLGTRSRMRQTERESLDNIFTELLSGYIPPSVLVDSRYELLHIFHNVNNYLQFPVGKASFNILKMMSKEMGAIVSSLLRRADKTKNPVVMDHITLEELSGNSLSISCRKLSVTNRPENYFLISFTEEEKLPKSDSVVVVENFNYPNHYTDQIEELEKELSLKSESLQATVEELETSNEELQSSNEELLASNEELQSTNEELQSVNEELYTVNAEHIKKIEELSEMTADLENLLKNTKIGVLFLDRDLKLRKINSIASEITHIQPSDRQRYIGHFALEQFHKGFLNLCQTVLKTLKEYEEEFYFQQKWLLLKVTPYRTNVNAVDGLIILFIDVTTRKLAEERRSLLFQTMNQGIVFQDEEGRIIDANHTAIDLLGLSLDQLKGVTSMDPAWKAIKSDGSDFPGDEHPAMKALKENRIVKDSYMGVFNPVRNARLWLKIQAIPLYRENADKPYQVYTIFEEVDEKEVKDHE